MAFPWPARSIPRGTTVGRLGSGFDGASSHPAFLPGGGAPSCIGPVACIAGDGIPQGDPLNPNPNGELLSPTDNLAFGRPIVTEFFDSNWAVGWGQKKANWELSGSIQHELADGVSVDVGYFRRTYVNFDAMGQPELGTRRLRHVHHHRRRGPAVA